MGGSKMSRRAKNAVSTVADKVVKKVGPEKAIRFFEDMGKDMRNKAVYYWSEPGFEKQAKSADHDAYCCDLAVIYIRQKWGV
jgi:hypothetical protein